MSIFWTWKINTCHIGYAEAYYLHICVRKLREPCDNCTVEKLSKFPPEDRSCVKSWQIMWKYFTVDNFFESISLTGRESVGVNRCRQWVLEFHGPTSSHTWTCKARPLEEVQLGDKHQNGKTAGARQVVPLKAESSIGRRHRSVLNQSVSVILKLYFSEDFFRFVYIVPDRTIPWLQSWICSIYYRSV